MSLNKLLLSVATLKERQAIHDNVDEKLIYPDIKAAQDTYLPRLLGTALFDKIIKDSNAGTLTGVYKTLVDDYVLDVLMNYVMSEIPIGISYQFWNKGILRKTADNTETPSAQEILMVKDKYLRRADMYADKLRRYLKSNYNSFPEYLNPGRNVDTDFPERDFNMPIYLGDDDDCKCNIP